MRYQWFGRVGCAELLGSGCAVFTRRLWMKQVDFAIAKERQFQKGSAASMAYAWPSGIYARLSAVPMPLLCVSS